MKELLVVGRGPSFREFDRWDICPDLMAVSSGIYAVPETHRPPTHFVSMDSPKWFMHPLHDPENDHAWQSDVEQWTFWRDERIQKHVPIPHAREGGYRELPEEIWDVIPPNAMRAFQRELTENLHLFGSVVGWGDFPSVRGWDVPLNVPPSFTDGEQIGMASAATPAPDGTPSSVRNSWFMAVQVAYRLGYRRLYFIGCDFNRKEYALCPDRAAEWWHLAKAAGMEWVNLSPDSILADIIPTEVSV